MKSYNFSDSNLKLVGEGCRDLMAFRGLYSDGKPYIVTGWTPTVDDIISLLKNEPIRLQTTGDVFPPVRLYTLNPDKQEVNPEFIDQDQVKDDFQKIKDYFRLLNSIPQPELEDRDLKIKMNNFFMQMFPLAKHATEMFMNAEEKMNQDKAIKDLIADAVFETEDGDEYNHLKLRRLYNKQTVDDILKLQINEVYEFASGSTIKRIK